MLCEGCGAAEATPSHNPSSLPSPPCPATAEVPPPSSRPRRKARARPHRQAVVRVGPQQPGDEYLRITWHAACAFGASGNAADALPYVRGGLMYVLRWQCGCDALCYAYIGNGCVDKYDGGTPA